MKLIVETVGAISPIDPVTNQVILHWRPTVVLNTASVQNWVSQRRLSVLAADLPDEANDAAFAEVWATSPEAAVEAYVAEVTGADPDKAAPPPKKTTGSAKGGKPPVVTKPAE